MNIRLMKTKSSPNKVKKWFQDSSDLVLENCKILNDTSIINPTILVDRWNTIESFSDYNYCYIPQFSRYYFITNIVVDTRGFVSIELKVDVLMTYSASILDNKQTIISEYDKGKMYLNGYDWQTDERTYTRAFYFTGDHFSTVNDSFVLITV